MSKVPESKTYEIRATGIELEKPNLAGQIRYLSNTREIQMMIKETRLGKWNKDMQGYLTRPLERKISRNKDIETSQVKVKTKIAPNKKAMFFLTTSLVYWFPHQ